MLHFRRKYKNLCKSDTLKILLTLRQFLQFVVEGIDKMKSLPPLRTGMKSLPKSKLLVLEGSDMALNDPKRILLMIQDMPRQYFPKM